MNAITGRLPSEVRAGIREWLVHGTRQPDLLPLMEAFARADMARDAIEGKFSKKNRYPLDVRRAENLADALERQARNVRRRRRDVEAVDRILEHLHDPDPRDIVAERRRDRNPLYGKSTVRGAARAKARPSSLSP